MRHLFIVNPIAGSVAKDDLIRHIIATATENKLEYALHLTRAPGDAEEFVRLSIAAQQGDLRVYSCGGDGTLNEVINGIKGAPGVEVAIIPVGSGNDFVRNFTDNAAFLDLEAQIRGSSIPVDLIVVNNRLAINLVNMGLDAIVASNMPVFRALGRLHSNLVYQAAVIKSIFRPLNSNVEISIDAEPWLRRNMVLLVAGNGAYYGGGYYAAPYAEVDDGALELCVISSIRHFELSFLLNLYKKGEHVRHHALEGRLVYQKCRELRVRSDQPLYTALDGEIEITRDITLKIWPAAQRVVMPHGVMPLKTK